MRLQKDTVRMFQFSVGDQVIVVRPDELYGWKGQVFELSEDNEGPFYVVIVQDPRFLGHQVMTGFAEEELADLSVS